MVAQSAERAFSDSPLGVGSLVLVRYWMKFGVELLRRALISSSGVQRFRPSSCGVDLRLIFLRNYG